MTALTNLITLITKRWFLKHLPYYLIQLRNNLGARTMKSITVSSWVHFYNIAMIRRQRRCAGVNHFNNYMEGFWRC